MPSDSKDQRPRRDPTGAMIGAALRAGHRRRPESGQKPESGGSMILTVLVLAVILFGTLFVMLTYGPK